MGKDLSEDCRGLCDISGFRREVGENCDLLGYYAASSGNFLLTFRETYRSHLQGPSFSCRVLRCGSGFDPEIDRKIARQFVQEGL